ncbi:MAG: hypothetical protein PHH26_05690 [Candidatus Thermoplasmatota archaeon]|nr:hypothetical protein [Candidatus Thermoplasmatota archaeon]
MKPRMKVAMAIIVGLALVLPVGVTLAAAKESHEVSENEEQGNGNGGKDQDEHSRNVTEIEEERHNEIEKERHDELEEERHEMMEEKKEEHENMWEEHHHIGGCSYQNGTIVGVFVAFSVDNQSGRMFDYTLRYTPNTNGTALFTTVSVAGVGVASTPTVHGAVARFVLGNVSVAAHDNPTGLLMLKSEGNNTVVFQVASGFEISATSNHTIKLNNGANGTIIISRGNYTVDNQTITITLLDEGKALFLAKPEQEDDEEKDDMEEEFEEGIAHGTIGAEVRVGNGRWIDKESFTNIDVDAAYDNATGTVTLNVGSDEEAGKVLAITVDNETLNQGALKVTYDGAEIQLVDNWGDLVAALKKSDTENGTAVYLVRPCEGGYRVFIAVPHFSDHTITIQGMAEVIKPVAVYVVLGAIAVVIIAAVVLFRRRKE